MVSLKINAKARETKSGFEPYDGPIPKQKGFYRASLKSVKFGRKKSGSVGFSIVAELEAAAGDPKDHAQYDGYPLFIQSIITEGPSGEELKEGAHRNLENFLAALGTGDNPNVVLEEGDWEDEPLNVKKIGSRNPAGAIVNIDLGFDTYDGEKRPTSNGIYICNDSAPSKKSSKVSAEELDDDDDLLDDVEYDESEELSYEERESDLKKLSVSELKAILKADYDLPVGGSKDELIDRILDHEYVSEEDSDTPAVLDDEIDEEEEELEEEIEEDDDADRDQRSKELDGFDREALKKIIKSIEPDFKVFKSTTDENLREAILDSEFGEEVPF